MSNQCSGLHATISTADAVNNFLANFSNFFFHPCPNPLVAQLLFSCYPIDQVLYFLIAQPI